MNTKQEKNLFDHIVGRGFPKGIPDYNKFICESNADCTFYRLTYYKNNTIVSKKEIRRGDTPSEIIDPTKTYSETILI